MRIGKHNKNARVNVSDSNTVHLHICMTLRGLSVWRMQELKKQILILLMNIDKYKNKYKNENTLIDFGIWTKKKCTYQIIW